MNVVDDWFQSSFSSKLVDMLVDPHSLIFRMVEEKRVRTLPGDHQSRRQDNHKLLFSLVLFEEWRRSARAVDREPTQLA